MKKIISAVSALMLCASVSFAATGLDYNQPYSYSFNHTAAVTQTTTYTILAADSLVNCDATSASFAVTLPSIDSLIAAGYGKKGYKIVKTDSSVNKVTVTPATGDTIGGESTRVLINDDSYMVITAEANGNWKVNYESPYIGENHEDGTVDINTYELDVSLIFEGATADAFETTLSATDPAADYTIVIPDDSGAMVTSTLATNEQDVANSFWFGTNQLIAEGATADAFETVVTPQDATADNSVVIPDDSGTLMTSTLATNGQDVANSVWFVSNSMYMEGATADAFEAIITPTDSTADRTFTLPDASGTVMLSSLATNGADAANAVTGTSNGLLFEGATADGFETTLTVTDPTADNTATLPNVSGTVAMISGLGSVKTVTAGSGTTTVATTDCGKVFTADSDANGVFNLFNIATANKGCEITFINVGADTNNLLTVNPDDSDTIDCISLSNAAAAVDIEGSAGDAISNTKATAEQGDNLTLVSDGVSGWYCKGFAVGIYADIN